jgi:hypothetical protein
MGSKFEWQIFNVMEFSINQCHRKSNISQTSIETNKRVKVCTRDREIAPMYSEPENFSQSSGFGSNFGKLLFFLAPSTRLSTDVRQPVEMKLPSGPHHSMNLCEHDRPIKDN